MSDDLTEILKQTALELGFELVEIVRGDISKTYDVFHHWIEAGCHAGMNYLARHREARRHPDSVLPGVRSILVLGVSYEKVLSSEDHPVKQLSGVAEYARGVDYHDWIRQRLKKLSDRHRELFPDRRCRGAVDTAPILERSLAVEAGFGRIGKNTMLITPEYGSKIFLAELLSSELLKTESVEPKTEPCGDCRRCLDACPTGALVEPYKLDARRCLNYWTIEHRGEMPEEIRKKLGNRFFGCDVCQDVCPWNEKYRNVPEGNTDPRLLDEKTLRAITVGSPLERWFEITDR